MQNQYSKALQSISAQADFCNFSVKQRLEFFRFVLFYGRESVRNASFVVLVFLHKILFRAVYQIGNLPHIFGGMEFFYKSGAELVIDVSV